MKNIPQFLANRAHPEHIRYIHPDLKGILEETYGIMVYQEQIINIARVMAGFSYGKADILRKAMSKKKLSELEKLEPEFINGCIAKGYPQKTAREVYDLILDFANYGFNKSHSIAYALVAYQLAYLKANYPLYFYKALLNGVIGSQSKTYDYIAECQNINQKVKGIDLNDSYAYYVIKDDHIVMPFTACKDVGHSTAEKIVTEREENGLFTDFVEAVGRLVNKSIDRGAIESLIHAGAFDLFGLGRYTMLSALDNVIMYEFLSELRDIAARDGISCTCGSKRYAIEIRQGAVDIICHDCGAKLRLSAATDEDLDKLCCRYTLTIQGK